MRLTVSFDFYYSTSICWAGSAHGRPEIDLESLTRNKSGGAIGVACIILLSLICGCAWNVDTTRRVASVATWGSTGVKVQRRSSNQLERPMAWWSNVTGWGGIKPDDRTQLFLRTYALEQEYRENPAVVLSELRMETIERPDLERLYFLADLAFVQGSRNRELGNEKTAGQMLATAVSASYQYLFDPRLDDQRNPYDPVFRKTCDIYNHSLEGLLRIMRDRDSLRPDGMFIASTLDGQPLRISISVSGRWQGEPFEKFEFVSDYNTKGLRNVHVTHGLGVPLIAIRKSSSTTDNSLGDSSSSMARSDEHFYPADLSVPLTAFVRMVPGESGSSREDSFAVQLIDPIEQSEVKVNDRFAPLESDITTPLAYYLDDPLLDANWLATTTLLNGDFARQFGGLYMLEPFDPDKIPVVMVHGFWSSPVTWTEMLNDLRADKTIRERYQFWFYLYPSGQPFWFSARQMREDLAQVQSAVDPQRPSQALSEMVLVGHSMGGLVSRLQTINSHDQFWNLISDRNVDELTGDPATLRKIRDTLYFDANPLVTRVITIGTPHKGSSDSNALTRWLSQKLITLPSNLTNEYNKIIKENPGFFKSDMLKITTSTDSLSPESRFLEVMMNAASNPRVRFHNIIGIHKPSGVSALTGGEKEISDGVVTVESARCPDALSEISIESEHSKIHQQPQAILEVRRILREHLVDVFGTSDVAESRQARR